MSGVVCQSAPEIRCSHHFLLTERPVEAAANETDFVIETK